MSYMRRSMNVRLWRSVDALMTAELNSRYGWLADAA